MYTKFTIARAIPVEDDATPISLRKFMYKIPYWEIKYNSILPQGNGVREGLQMLIPT